MNLESFKNSFRFSPLQKLCSFLFEFIVDDLKIQKEQILFWDDTQRNIDAATNFGIHAEFYLNFEDFRNKTEHHLL